MKMATFTALNGGSPKAAEAVNVNGAVDMARSASDDQQRANGQAGPGPDGPKPAAADRTTPQREREPWPPAGLDRPPYQAPAYPDTPLDNPHKRKRSGSVEGRREERADEAAAQQEPRDPYRSPPQRDYRPYGDEGRERERERERDRERDRDRDRDRDREQHDPWYSQQSRDDRSYEPPASAHPGSATTDIDMRNQMNDDYQTSPDGDERSMMYSGYSPDQRRDGLIQSDPKKRKRNFSNRTKTGCLTCRKRKKKCDEAKPECSNCVRGGFACAGYPPQRGTWQKPESKPTTIQIESKDPTYVPPGAYGMPQQAPYGNHGPLPHQQQQKREPLPSYRGQPLRIEPPQGRPLQTDDERPTASTLPSASVASPDNKLSALSAYTQTANVFPTPVSAAPVPFPDRTPKEYQRVPPLHDLNRGEADLPAHGNTLPQIHILHATRTNSPTSQAAQQQQQQQQQPQQQQSQPSSGVQATAALALSHTSQFPSNRPRREKDEMLGGRQYYPFDKELVLERERCSAACWRFNNSTNPNNGVSPNERARLFREILQPREGVQISPTAISPVTHTGQVGAEVVVEAPFTADYGYNIRIGKNVLVGRNCTVVDCCDVTIGDNTIIGPNVSIYTATLPTDPKRRGGAKGTQYGKPVVIEEDVFIGANVIILPGVRIGKGTTIGAGSLVTKNLPKFCVCYGSPADVRRGVASV